MQISWFTVIAQIFNFAILVYILNKVLYKPVIDMMENRRKSVKDAIEEAENKLSDAEKKKNEYYAKVKEFEDLKEERMRDLKVEIEEKRKEMMETLKSDIEKEKNKLNTFLEVNRREIISSISNIISEKISVFMKDVFLSISDESLDNKSLDKFLSKLEKLDPLKLAELNNNSEINNGEIKFSTAYALDKQKKDNVIALLKKVGVNFKEVDFVTEEDMIFGAELKVGSFIISSDAKSVVDEFKINLETII